MRPGSTCYAFPQRGALAVVLHVVSRVTPEDALFFFILESRPRAPAEDDCFRTGCADVGFHFFELAGEGVQRERTVKVFFRNPQVLLVTSSNQGEGGGMSVEAEMALRSTACKCGMFFPRRC